MMRNLKRISVVAVAFGAIFTAISTGSAQALGVDAFAACETTGVYASGTFHNWTNNYTDMELYVLDEGADRHHVGVRFVSKNANGSIRYWTWHEVFAGKGSHITVDTSASTAESGLSLIGVQGAVMEGSDIVRSCIDWAQ
jgi:hypothetical protein